MNSKLLLDCLNIRNFENQLLDLFPTGVLKGTTHTSLGQETNAVGVLSALNRDDIVVSNHRCHGHYLSHTSDFIGLLNEILGKDDGVCGGNGGSQHLNYKNKFYSNGILGGNTAMAAGISYAIKFKKDKKIVCLFIGDGTFGQGILYETLNIISNKKLPILIVVEDNKISQSTITKSVLSGTIKNKIKSFDIETIELDYPDIFTLNKKTTKIIKDIRSYKKPYCIIIKSNRLGPHSKSDDTRSKKELNDIYENDTLEKSFKLLNNQKKTNELKQISKDYISQIFKKCINSRPIVNKLEVIDKNNQKFIETNNILNKNKNKRLSEIINLSLHELFNENENLVLLGEDLLDPYGGAFKISKGLSTNFPNRIYSSPISEAGIIGLATGMAIQGLKPIVEIMFGDFLTLGFDQILNNACKFRKMYNYQVKVPLVIRTPMGGRRGYGPTHSQSIEKHFFGIDGLNIYAINPFQNVKEIYGTAINNLEPSLIIENKIDYGFIIKKVDNNIYNDFHIEHSKSNLDFNVSFSLTNFEEDNGTIICYGGMINFALDAAKRLYLDEEISFRVVCIGKIHPVNIENLFSCLTKNGKIVTVEESTSDFGIGSEICFELFKSNRYEFIDKIGSSNSLIPSSFDKEKGIMLDDKKIYNYLKKII